MSLPQLPKNDPSITRDDAINQILSSIAMEELGLSHIINAEGEKLQYALGTITGVSGPEKPATIEDLLSINQSIRDTLDGTMQNQMLLKGKLQAALTASVMKGATGPTGPAGPIGPAGSALVSGFQAELTNETGTATEIQPNGFIPFGKPLYQSTTDFEYDATTGTITINKAGQNNLYLIQWWVLAEGSDTTPMKFDLYVGNTRHPFESQMSDGQESGSVLVPVTKDTVEVSLRNASTEIVNLVNASVQAQITIIGLHAMP